MKEKCGAVLARLSIEGIQKYIFATGKLKEMIGASEIIHEIARLEYFGKFLSGAKEVAPEKFRGNAGEYVLAQNNAGKIGLIFSGMEEASGFLREISGGLLREFPGLPFYGACRQFEWSDDEDGYKSYADCFEKTEEEIERARNIQAAPHGCPMLPILRVARLDGMPAAGKEDEQYISLPSLVKRDRDLLKKARDRLKGYSAMEQIKDRLEWKDNLEEMLNEDGNEKGSQVALVCMDGNGMGKLFEKCRQNSSGSPVKNIQDMREMSKLVQECNERAFGYACAKIARALLANQEYASGDKKLIMPLRPIVMGGDDVTVIARADCALPFITLFTAEFERAAKEEARIEKLIGKGGLSIGTGMVVMNSSYPFVKAFPLAESLQDSAKNLSKGMEPRPSSLDYLVLTEEVEDNLEKIRERLFRGAGGEILTSKPFNLSNNEFVNFLEKGIKANRALPRSQIRQAWTVARKGENETRRLWLNLKENIKRGIGGRGGELLKMEDFLEIWPDNFFYADKAGEKPRTALGDYLELDRLLPEGSDDMFKLIREAGENA